MKNMKISKRLTIGFGSLIVLIIIISIMAVTMATFIDNEYTYLVDFPEKRANTLLEVSSLVNSTRQTLSHMAVFSGLPDAEKNINAQSAVLEDTLEHLQEHLGEYEDLITTDYKLSSDEKNTRITALKNIRDLLDRYKKEVVTPVTQANLEGRREDVIAIAGAVKQISEELISSIEDLVTVAKDLSHELNESTGNTTIILIFVLSGLSVLTIVIGIVLAVAIAKSIISGLRNSLHTMQDVCDTVAQSSKQLSQASSQLADSASSQAAGVQETSATMNETASMIKQTKDNTGYAANLSVDTEQSAVKSVKNVDHLMEVMNKLSESSMEINKIADTITSIASQTNILALNASVEAARVGDAGKGFAVVAEEVRTLSIKSSEAANNTTKIIKENIELAIQGLENSKSVSDSLNGIFADVQKVSTLLSEIAKASEEQSSGVTQIASAVSQMEQSTQSNASVAEQSSAAANDLMNSSNILSEATADLAAMI